MTLSCLIKNGSTAKINKTELNIAKINAILAYKNEVISKNK